MGPIQQYADEKVEGPLVLWVHPGANGTFSLYEDDGKTFNYRRGEYTRLRMAWNDAGRRLRLSLEPGSRMIAPARRNVIVRLAGESGSRDVVFAGKSVELKL